MKKLTFIFLAALSLSSFLYGQTENESVFKDSLNLIKKESGLVNEKLNNYLDIDKPKPQIIQNDYKNYQFIHIEKFPAPELYLPPIKIYSGPPLINDSFTHYPFANDYSFNNFIPMRNNLWISTLSRQNTYPTLGEVRKISANLNYQPTNWLTISAGPYAAKYTIGNPYIHNNVGVNGSAKFILHDRIRLNAYGQYAAYGKTAELGIPTLGMYPQTYYGGTIEIKITEKFGVEGGVMRELNPFTGKWVNTPYIAPVFYSK